MNVPRKLLSTEARRKARTGLACLLLLTIGYTAIVEAAHSHGFSSTRRSQLTAIADNSNSQSSSQGLAHQSDCSLCQFQRQLFGGLAPVILVALAPQHVPLLFREAVSYLSVSALPVLGRAPPLI